MTRRYPEPVFQTPPPPAPLPRALRFVAMIALLVTVGVFAGVSLLGVR